MNLAKTLCLCIFIIMLLAANVLASDPFTGESSGGDAEAPGQQPQSGGAEPVIMLALGFVLAAIAIFRRRK